MENGIFRKKSMERVSSPEQLNDYVKVSNPSVWIILAGVILLLAGVCVWSVFGNLDTRLMTAAVVKDKTGTCYVKEAEIASVRAGQRVQIDGKECAVLSVSDVPTAVTRELGDYTLHLGGLSVGEWVYEVTFATDLPNGIYGAYITIDSVSPMSFVFN